MNLSSYTQLFTDFVLADFLVTHTPFVSSVVFQYVQSSRPTYSSASNDNCTSPKLIPWFVSDVTPPDFSVTISSLLNPSFFPPPATDEAIDPSLYGDLFHMVSRWQKYVDDGTFKLSVPLNTPLGASRLGSTESNLADFWTSPYPYWDMESRAPLLWKSLSESGLVIFKVRLGTDNFSTSINPKSDL